MYKRILLMYDRIKIRHQQDLFLSEIRVLRQSRLFQILQ